MVCLTFGAVESSMLQNMHSGDTGAICNSYWHSWSTSMAKKCRPGDTSLPRKADMATQDAECACSGAPMPEKLVLNVIRLAALATSSSPELWRVRNSEVTARLCSAQRFKSASECTSGTGCNAGSLCSTIRAKVKRAAEQPHLRAFGEPG